MKHAEDALKKTLQATPECLPLERLSETLTAHEQQHLDGCVHCQTELRLWREFAESEASQDEGAAVKWIVAELKRRNRSVSDGVPARRLAWLTPAVRRWATAVASVVLLTAVGYLAWDRVPSVRAPGTVNETYRTGRIQVVRPLGDLPAPPESLEWTAAADAITYEVSVLEVDGTLLWRTTSSATHIGLPPSVVRQLVPGKTVVWEVHARNAANTVIAESGRQQFRVELAR